MKASELRALLEGATAGPWRAEDGAAAPSCAWGVVSETPDAEGYRQIVVEHDFVGESDAKLIAALRNAAPVLVDLLQAVEELGAARAAYDSTGAHTCDEDDELRCELCERFADSRAAATAVHLLADRLHNDRLASGAGEEG